eukprot:CAMPEP_0181453668 /NCGR_PEP_ID=MMETSP1110-20121109/29843_1 /TAXON_ID=174948 /ORGANISM="Symbiodinium sp., Strain CCMP421" /LENGTH=438 /DNA_ID=CAMNT_0023577993 /DNA_START=67 /DNA_END=1384 /DNA_ORIENTATION=+
MINFAPSYTYCKAVTPLASGRDADWESSYWTKLPPTRTKTLKALFPRGCSSDSARSRLLKWSASVQSLSMDVELKVTLSAGYQQSRLAAAFGQDTIPRCAIHVWAEAADGTQLAEVWGSVCPKNTLSAVFVHWISRAKSIPTVPGDDWRLMATAEKGKCPWTIPQALLGILAKIAETFGMAFVELGAEDHGSGKLVQYYTQLGFRGKTQRPVLGEHSMDAPIDCISALAPDSWLSALPLAEFNAWPWLWGNAERPSLSYILHLMGAPDTWSWATKWPRGGTVQVRTVGVSDRDGSKVAISAYLRDSWNELLYCRAVVRLQQGKVRVIWIGSSGSKPAHSSVRGRLLDGSLRKGLAGSITVAVALLGSVACTARWFGIDMMELTAMDDGSGRLLPYLQSLGFEVNGDLAQIAKLVLDVSNFRKAVVRRTGESNCHQILI